MTPEEIQKSHRRFAVECNNRAWDLATQAERSPAENREMLLSAHAAAFHWSKVGTPLNDVRAEVLLAHVHALLEQGAEALRYAEQVLKFCESNPCEDWDLAFAYAEMAFAASTVDEAILHRKFYELAEAQGPAIKDEEDRAVFLTEFARISRPVA
jgi:hypothetical protein